MSPVGRRAPAWRARSASCDPLDSFVTRYIKAYANEIAAFVAALEAGRPMTPSGEDGLKAMAMAEAAAQSAATG